MIMGKNVLFEKPLRTKEIFSITQYTVPVIIHNIVSDDAQHTSKKATSLEVEAPPSPPNFHGESNTQCDIMMII